MEAVKVSSIMLETKSRMHFLAYQDFELCFYRSLFFTFTEQVVKDCKRADFIVHAVHLISKEWENYYGSPVSKRVKLFKDIFKKQKPEKAMDAFQEYFNKDSEFCKSLVQLVQFQVYKQIHLHYKGVSSEHFVSEDDIFLAASNFFSCSLEISDLSGKILRVKPISPQFQEGFLKSMIVRVGKRSEYLESYYGQTYLLRCPEAPEVVIRIDTQVFKQHQAAFKKGPIKSKKKDLSPADYNHVIKPPQSDYFDQFPEIDDREDEKKSQIPCSVPKKKGFPDKITIPKRGLKQNRAYVQMLKKQCYSKDPDAEKYQKPDYITFTTCMDSVPKQTYLNFLDNEYHGIMDVNSLFRWKESKLYLSLGTQCYETPRCEQCRIRLNIIDLCTLFPQLDAKLIAKLYEMKVNTKASKQNMSWNYELQFDLDVNQSSVFPYTQIHKMINTQSFFQEIINIALNLQDKATTALRDKKNLPEMVQSTRDLYKKILKIYASARIHLPKSKVEETGNFEFLKGQGVQILKIRDKLGKLCEDPGSIFD